MTLDTIENNLLKPRHCPNCNECKMILSYDSYTETLEKQKQKDRDIDELKRSVAFLSDRFNAFLISQPENKLLFLDEENETGIVKGIQLKPEINNIATAEVIPSSSLLSRRKSKSQNL